MSKRAISVTLEQDNIIWLKGRLEAAGCSSVSELIDRLITSARTDGRVVPSRSVVGTIGIAPTDPLLEGADAALRALFESSIELSIERPDTVRLRRPRKRRKTPQRG